MRFGLFARLRSPLGALVLLFGLVTGEGAAQSVPPTPPPPIPGNPTASPSIQLPPASTAPTVLPTIPPPIVTPTPTPAPRRGRRGTPEPTGSPNPSPSGSGTPAPPQFTTLDGVWEIELQTRVKTYYSHITLKQSGTAGSDVTGFWLRENKKLPLTGTFDGRLFKFTAADGGTQYTLSGYVENFSDIVGLISDGKTQNAFTAQHRKREKTF